MNRNKISLSKALVEIFLNRCNCRSGSGQVLANWSLSKFVVSRAPNKVIFQSNYHRFSLPFGAYIISSPFIITLCSWCGFVYLTACSFRFSLSIKIFSYVLRLPITSTYVRKSKSDFASDIGFAVVNSSHYILYSLTKYSYPASFFYFNWSALRAPKKSIWQSCELNINLRRMESNQFTKYPGNSSRVHGLLQRSTRLSSSECDEKYHSSFVRYQYFVVQSAQVHRIQYLGHRLHNRKWTAK